jgi:hypothetical protein
MESNYDTINSNILDLKFGKYPENWLRISLEFLVLVGVNKVINTTDKKIYVFIKLSEALAVITIIVRN